MGFPTSEVISAGTRVRLKSITGTGNTPTQYTLTVDNSASPVAQGSTTIPLVADVAVFIQHDEILDFGGTLVTVNLPDTSGLNDVIEVTTGTPVNVPVLATSAAIPDATAATTYALRDLLGITDASPSEQPQTVDTTDMRSGFGQKQAVVGVNRTISVNGFKITGDRAMYEVVMPYLTSDTTIRNLVWCEQTLANGDKRSGPARITDASGTNQVRNPMGYALTFTFQGNLFNFTNGDTALFTP